MMETHASDRGALSLIACGTILLVVAYITIAQHMFVSGLTIIQ